MVRNPILYADSFNFGPKANDVLTVQQMTEMAIEIWGKGTFIFPELEEQPHEAGLLSLSIKKAETILNWKPLWNAHQALSNTLEWYQSFYNGESIIPLMNRQIDPFFFN